MTQRAKTIVTFLCGLVTGIVLLIAFSLVYQKAATGGSPFNSDLVMFDQPQNEVESAYFRVIHVLPNGNALATNEGIIAEIIVLFLAKDNESYYDAQFIEVPDGQRAMQIGTYRYVTKEDIVKTVPVVDFFDE